MHDIEPAWYNNDINDDHTIKERKIERATPSMRVLPIALRLQSNLILPLDYSAQVGQDACTRNDRLFIRFFV